MQAALPYFPSNLPAFFLLINFLYETDQYYLDTTVYDSSYIFLDCPCYRNISFLLLTVFWGEGGDIICAMCE
jgi:hypothetical protein